MLTISEYGIPVRSFKALKWVIFDPVIVLSTYSIGGLSDKKVTRIDFQLVKKLYCWSGAANRIAAF